MSSTDTRSDHLVELFHAQDEISRLKAENRKLREAVIVERAKVLWYTWSEGEPWGGENKEEAESDLRAEGVIT